MKMNFTLKCERKEQLKEAIREILRGDQKCEKIKKVIEGIIEDNIQNLNNLRREIEDTQTVSHSDPPIIEREKCHHDDNDDNGDDTQCTDTLCTDHLENEISEETKSLQPEQHKSIHLDEIRSFQSDDVTSYHSDRDLPSFTTRESIIENCHQPSVMLDSSSVAQHLLDEYIERTSRLWRQREGDKRKFGFYRENVRNSSKTVVMDHRGIYELELSSENIHTQSITDFEYQIYYKGKAISKEDMKKILNSKVLKKRGQYLCSIHDDCPFAKPPKEPMDQGKTRLLQHLGYSSMTYLCRQCYHTCGSYSNLVEHFKIHSKGRVLSTLQSGVKKRRFMIGDEVTTSKLAKMCFWK